jgi:branched-chain amino acid transport system ATP-binding protein
MTDALLNVINVSHSFGGLMAIQNLSFNVRAGQIKAVIGPNGAGKTTLFNLITGVIPVTYGSIKFKGRDITALKSYEIARLGVSRTFQNVRLFARMTVLENVMIGRHCRTGSSIFSAGLRLSSMKHEEKEILSDSLKILRFVGLYEKAQLIGSELPIGDQKVLEIARALATEPSLLLVDEPVAGLNDVESASVAGLIEKIRASGTTILLVEHDMKVVMGISDEILVLNYGEKIAEGLSDEVKHDERVISAYLGEEEDA